MELIGQKIVAAPPDKVWAALVDPAFLKSLIPGCETMTGSPETGYDITVTRRVGNMEARLRGRFEMSEVEPGRGCLLTGGGSGGGAGGAKGTARIALVPVGEGTRLSWDIRAELEGKLASVPGFLVNMAARRVAHGFVERFAAEVEHRKVEPRTGLIGRIMGR